MTSTPVQTADSRWLVERMTKTGTKVRLLAAQASLPESTLSQVIKGKRRLLAFEKAALKRYFDSIPPAATAPIAPLAQLVDFDAPAQGADADVAATPAIPAEPDASFLPPEEAEIEAVIRQIERLGVYWAAKEIVALRSAGSRQRSRPNIRPVATFTSIEPSEPQQILKGADVIASYLGFTRRQVYHMAAEGRLPVFRIGSSICAHPEKLRTWIDKVTVDPT